MLDTVASIRPLLDNIGRVIIGKPAQAYSALRTSSISQKFCGVHRKISVNSAQARGIIQPQAVG